MYPPKLIKKPFIWEVGHKFKVVTNIRQASVTDEIGIVCLELDGHARRSKGRDQMAGKTGRERRASGDRRDRRLKFPSDQNQRGDVFALVFFEFAELRFNLDRSVRFR